MIIATLDIGTNTALLLICEIDIHRGTLKTIYNAQEIVRLGQGVDKDRVIHPEAIGRLISALQKYQRFLEAYKVEKVIAVGTSALRDAKNRQSILTHIHTQFGYSIELLSGNEEAELTFLGAITGMSLAESYFLVMDIGGGSTELILGYKDGETWGKVSIIDKVSIDMGSVRMTERFFKSIPPSQEDIEAAKQELVRQIAPRQGTFIRGREKLIAVAGTATTIAQIALGLNSFSATDIHGYEVKHDEARGVFETVLTKRTEDIESLGVSSGRADVLTAGALIFHTIMRLFSVNAATISIQGLRYGVALRQMERERASKSMGENI